MSEPTDPPDSTNPPDATVTPDDEAAAQAAAAALRRATRSTGAAKKGGTKRRRPAPSGSRDPEPLGAALERLVVEQGWQDQSAVATLMGDWAEIVGADLAAHVVPVSFTDGELVLQAESTTWATQLRLLLPQVHRAIDDRVGTGVVRAIRLRGPQAPSWGAGPRRVKGRGPRDTYG
jgi:predicted nucleic acid-binding Zn ribbon protein